MNDSCSDRKLDPGLAATYSKPSDLNTSTMKSDPGRSVVITSTCATGSPSGGPGPSLGAGGAATCGAAIAPVPMASVPILPAAAPFRNPRRPGRSASFLEFAMAEHTSAFCAVAWKLLSRLSTVLFLLLLPKSAPQKSTCAVNLTTRATRIAVAQMCSAAPAPRGQWGRRRKGHGWPVPPPGIPKV